MNTHCSGLPLEWCAYSECKALVWETADQTFLRFLKLHFVPKTVPGNCHLQLQVAVCPLPAEVTGHAEA